MMCMLLYITSYISLFNKQYVKLLIDYFIIYHLEEKRLNWIWLNNMKITICEKEIKSKGCFDIIILFIPIS